MNLLRQIEIYLADNNINRTNFGKHVMRDGGFITRVMATGEANMRQRTIDKCRQFMMDNPNADGIPKIQQKPSLGRKRNRSTNHIGLKSLSPGFRTGSTPIALSASTGRRAGGAVCGATSGVFITLWRF